MSNKQKRIMINRTIEKLGLQIGSPIWYELICLTVEGVNNASAKPLLPGEVHLLITPEKDADVERIEKELKTLFHQAENAVFCIDVYIVMMTE